MSCTALLTLHQIPSPACPCRLPSGLLFGLPVVMDTSNDAIKPGAKVRCFTRLELRESVQGQNKTRHAFQTSQPFRTPRQLLLAQRSIGMHSFLLLPSTGAADVQGAGRGCDGRGVPLAAQQGERADRVSLRVSCSLNVARASHRLSRNESTYAETDKAELALPCCFPGQVVEASKCYGSTSLEHPAGQRNSAAMWQPTTIQHV